MLNTYKMVKEMLEIRGHGFKTREMLGLEEIIVSYYDLSIIISQEGTNLNLSCTSENSEYFENFTSHSAKEMVNKVFEIMERY